MERGSGLLAVISTAVLVFAAVGFAVAALLVRLDTSELRTRAHQVEHESSRHVAATATATADLAALHADAERAYASLGALAAAYQGQIAAQNHAIDVANAAADSYNTGQANIADALKSEAQAAVDDADAKAAAVRAALVQVQEALSVLRQDAG